MSGSDASFDPVAFRAGILFAMNMGSPVDPADAPIFIFPSTPASGSDEYGVPWASSGDYVEPVTELTGIACAVEFHAITDVVAQDGQSVQGGIATLTFLETEYQKIKGCSAVKLSGVVYSRYRDDPAFALFSAGIHQIEFMVGDL